MTTQDRDGLIGRVKGAADRRIDWRVETSLTPRLDSLSSQIEEVRAATVELRRLVTDDLDASNESAALLGRAIASLAETVAVLQGDVAAIRKRLDAPAP